MAASTIDGGARLLLSKSLSVWLGEGIAFARLVSLLVACSRIASKTSGSCEESLGQPGYGL